jgi:hypothetical protein
MAIEKVTQQQRFTNTNVIIGGDSDPLTSGLSVYDKITNTDTISSQGEIYTDKNLIATGNVSATDVSVTGYLYVTGGIVAPGTTTEVSPDKIKISDGSLGDVLKLTEKAGLTAYSPGRVTVEELSSIASLLLDGAVISYDGDKKTFTVKNPEEATTYESSYIKQLAKSTCVSSNNSTTAYKENVGYAATTNDGRVIAWGYIPENIFSKSTTVTPYENIRVPFWAQYDGYTDPLLYGPYGGDILDTLTGTNIVDVYWSSNCAMALLSSADEEYDGSVWVAGKNLAGAGIQTNLNPISLVKTKFDSLLILNNTSTITAQKLILLNAEKDVCGVLKYTPVATQSDIIIDKTNNNILSTDSHFYISTRSVAPTGNGFIARINHFGELVSTHYSAVSSARLCVVSGIAMSYQDKDGKNLLYVCDTSANQSKVKVFDITDNALSAMPLISAIGTGQKTHIDADTEVATPAFKDLRKIAIDPSNQNILYVIDEWKIKRIYRKDNGFYKVNTISDRLGAGEATGEFSIVDGIATAKFSNPQAIAVSNDGKNLFIADMTSKKIQKVNISRNDENNFNASSEYYVDTKIENPASFSSFEGMTKDNNGNLYIADKDNNAIRKLAYDSTNKAYGIVTTYAAASANADTIPLLSNTDVKAKAPAATKLSETSAAKLSAVRFSSPGGIAYAPDENALYVTNKNTYVHGISRIDMSLSSVSIIGSNWAGTATPWTSNAAGVGLGYLSGAGLSGGRAQFFNPINLCYGVSGTDKYIWVVNRGTLSNPGYIDYIKQIKIQGSHNYEITNLTKVNAAPTTTFTLSNSAFANNIYLKTPFAIIYDNVSNSLYFSNFYAVQKINLSDKRVYNVVGSDKIGNLAGAAGNARLGEIKSLAISGDFLYIGDITNKKIWKLEKFRSSLSADRVLTEFLGEAGSPVKFSRNPQSLIIGNEDDFILQDYNQIKRCYYSNGLMTSKILNGVPNNPLYKNTTYSNIDWLPSALFMDSDDRLYYTEQVSDQAGFILDKKLYPYKNMSAGTLGIGVGNNKTTCGFIRVKAEDANGVAKFKKIQMVVDKEPTKSTTKPNSLFAALDTEDSLWLWGYSPDGAFGNGFINEMGPTKIYQFEKNIKDFKITCATSMGGNRTLISLITKDNKMYSAGDNSWGQLGRNTGIRTDPRYLIFRQCKKQIGNTISFVDDAEKLIESTTSGFKNNFYISTLSTVWACGEAVSGQLGRGPLGISAEHVFMEVDNLTNIKQIFGNLGTTDPTGKNGLTVFALKDNGELYSWGWNGNVGEGSTLSNNKSDPVIYTPTNCYNFELKDVVRDAKYVFLNQDFRESSNASYIDNKNNLYIGGKNANVELPDLPTYTSYFRKFNMKNIMPDVCMINNENIVRKSNGTVYTINPFGAKKVF